MIYDVSIYTWSLQYSYMYQDVFLCKEIKNYVPGKFSHKIKGSLGKQTHIPWKKGKQEKKKET